MASSYYTICEPTILEKVDGWLTRCRRCAGGRIPLYEGYIVDPWEKKSHLGRPHEENMLLELQAWKNQGNFIS